MRRFGVAMLAVVSALSLLATASASAAPTFQECTKVKSGTGEFISKSCTGTPTGGEIYTRFAPAKKNGENPTYKGKTKTVTFETPGVGDVTCKKGSEAGSISGESGGTDTITLSDCEATKEGGGGKGHGGGGKGKSGPPCTTAGETAGTIKTQALKMSLRQTGEVVEEVLKGTGEEELVAEFSCEALTVALKGKVAGALTGDIDTTGATNTVELQEAGGLEAEVVGTGVQAPTNVTATLSFKLPKGIGVYEGLETVEGAEASVVGAVTEGEAAVPLDEAIVSVCKAGTNACRKAISSGAGSYEVTDLPPGEYLAKVSPPLDARGDDVMDEAFTVGLTGTQVENFKVPTVVPPPQGVTAKGGLGTAPNGIPILKWTEPTPISVPIAGCTEPVTGRATGTNATNGRVETREWTMTEKPAGSGVFTGAIPALMPIHGIVAIQIFCGSKLIYQFIVLLRPERRRGRREPRRRACGGRHGDAAELGQPDGTVRASA